jgi:hypothetical protein
LAEALNSVAKASSLTIAVDWDALRPAGIGPDSLVRAEGKGLTAAQAIDLVLARVENLPTPLSWYEQDGVVRITTQQTHLLRRRLEANIAGMPYVRATARPDHLSATLPIMELQGIQLGDAIEVTRMATGLNVFVNWNALRKAGIEKDTPISLTARNIPVAKALDLILDSLNAGRGVMDSAYWVIDDGVVVISTGEELNRDLSVRVYDVADVLMVVSNFRGPRIPGQNQGGNQQAGTNAGTGGDSGLFGGDGANGQAGAAGTDEEDPQALRHRVRDDLTATIRNSIGEQFWQPQGKGSIAFVGGQMVVSQTQLGFALMGKALSR